VLGHGGVPVIAARAQMRGNALAPCLRRGKLLRKTSTVCGVSRTSTSLRAKRWGTL
jgi:hypothetical protein